MSARRPRPPASAGRCAGVCAPGTDRAREAAEAAEAEPAEAPVDDRGAGRRLTYRPASTHIHAVPTNGEMKATRAVELFNASDHPRTVAGVARSLGAPGVTRAPR